METTSTDLDFLESRRMGSGGAGDRKHGQRGTSVNMRVSDVARYLLEYFQEYYGLSQASVVEMLLREEARRKGVSIPGSGSDRARREADAESIRRLEDAKVHPKKPHDDDEG